MKIATSLNICPPYLTETELMPRLAAAGYDGLDFNFCDLYDRADWSDERQSDAFVAPWGAAAESAGLSWVQAHGPMFSMFGDAPEDIRRREMCPEVIRVCGRLRVPWMVLHPGNSAGAFDAGHTADLLARNVAFFRSLLPHCERYGVGIAIENMPESRSAEGTTRRFGANAEELIQLIDALDHPLIGACWDTGHARINALDQQAAIVSLGPRLKVLHIQENDGKGDDHMLPFVNGTGGVSWQAVTEGLRQAKFGGAFTFEVHNGFRALPEPLFDVMLHTSTAIARHLASQVTADRTDRTVK